MTPEHVSEENVWTEDGGVTGLNMEEVTGLNMEDLRWRM
jgi:hypothetical protein